MSTSTLESRTSIATRRDIARGAWWGAGAALAVNMAIWLIGRAREPVRVVAGWAPDGADLTVAEIVIATVGAVGLGALLLRWMQRDRDRFRSWTITVVSVAIVSSMPLWRLDVGTGSKLALTCMHLATGAAAVAAQVAVRRGAAGGAT